VRAESGGTAKREKRKEKREKRKEKREKRKDLTQRTQRKLEGTETCGLIGRPESWKRPPSPRFHT
jgi:hypothetical protein